MSKPLSVFNILLFSILVSGCATYQKPDWSQYKGPGKEYFVKEEVQFPDVPDKLEPMNRVLSGFNHGLMTGFVQPFSWVYRSVLPSFARTGITNAFDNAYYPVRVLSNIFQGKWEGVSQETRRFAINTTYGVLGLWDRATEMNIKPAKEDFGQTFGAWGWRNSNFLTIPILGPSTIRDGVGSLADVAFDPLSYFFPATQIRGSTRLGQGYPKYKRFVELNFDAYEWGKLLYVLNRELRIDEYQYKARTDETGVTETLQSVFLTYKDEDFPGRGKTYKVLLPNTGKELAYTVWMPEQASELVYVIPGTGGHRLGNSALAVAEVIQNDGRSAVTISSAMNFEFIQSGSTVDFPGFVPADAHDVHMALDAINKDMDKRFPGRFTKRDVVGLSLGGSHVLFMAAESQSPQNELIKFDHYTALNAPVSSRHTAQQLDDFYNVPLRYPQGEQRDRMIQAVLWKVLDLSENEDLQPGEPLPFAEWEAKFLIGLSFRKDLGDIIFETENRQDLIKIANPPTMLRKSFAHRESYEYSFMEYIYAFVLPYYANKWNDISYDEAGVRRLFELSDLRFVAAQLKNNPKISFFSNKNDFLLRSEDIAWLKALFGERAYFFERGGHLGNLSNEDVQEAISRKVQQDKLRQ